MLNLLKQDAKVGDTLNLYLTSGNSVKGTIIEIDENYLLMEVDGVKRRYFPQLIGGWDVVNEVSQSESQDTSINEQTAEVEEKDKEESIEDEINDVIISLFDSIFVKEHLALSAIIKTNAVVDKVLPTGVSVVTDSGEKITCLKGFMVGFSRINCTPGKRLFCCTDYISDPQKDVCTLSVLEMSFKEIREQFIMAVLKKPLPRKPIINSIIAYFRKNNSGKPTKKIIIDLRNKVKLLNTTGKVGNTQLDKYISFKQYDKALELIECEISSAEDDKHKSALLLRKAQLYSSIKEHEKAISAYRELISFNESINAPTKSLSHLYTEVARLLLLTGDKEQAEGARNIALMLNPLNSIAKKMNGLDNIIDDSAEKTLETINQKPNEDLHSFQIVKFTNRSLIDDDINRHKFVDSEIVSLNGDVSIDIANRLLESASTSDDFLLHIEAAKALKSLPIGSYDIQDLEDSITNYSICKCRSLFNSYKKVVLESDSVDNISIEQLNKIKDCAICYSIEAIEAVVEEDNETATKLLTDCLLVELSSLLIIKKKSKNEILEVLDLTLEELILRSISPEWRAYVPVLFEKLVSLSIQIVNIWDTIILKSPHFNHLLSYVSESIQIKEDIISLTPKGSKRDVNSNDYINIFRHYVSSKLSMSYSYLQKMERIDLYLSSLRPLQKKCKMISSKTYIWCLNDTDQKSIVNICHLISILLLYQKKNREDRMIIVSNALIEIDEILKWNNGATATKLGRFYFYPLLLSWKKYLSALYTHDEYNDSCLLSLEMDSPYYFDNGDSIRNFKIVIYNKSNLISEGYKLAVWIGENKKNGINKTDNRFILPNSNVQIEIPIPQEQWGDLNIYELNFAISSRYQGKWSTTQITNASITNKHDVLFNYGDIKWKDRGYPSKEMFKGRDEIVQSLKDHYCSNNRCYSYILYGLSKTGKSTILDYLKKAIGGCVINESKSSKIVLPIYIDLGAVYGNTTKHKHNFWKLFINVIFRETRNFISKYLPEKTDKLKKTEDFSQFVIEMSELNIHPLFMFDEFSYMQDVINDGYINSAFLQYMRTISADKDLVSFIFAGTYDIKQLIRDSKYNISGAFTYLKEPDKPIFEISHEAAEELINMMQGKLDFSNAAKREIHRLTGDVPFWIQKLCLNCATYAIENNKPDIGLQDLDTVVCKMVGEPCKLEKTDIPSLNVGTFKNTQILDTDTEEIKIVLTSISHLMKNADMSNGVSYDQIKVLWIDNNVDILKYNIRDALVSLCERKTLVYEDNDNIRYYRYSIDLFRRWWLHEHIEFELELSDFIKKVK